MKKIVLTVILLFSAWSLCANPVGDLLERVDKGASAKFDIIIIQSDKPYFKIESPNDKIVVVASDYVSASTGVNWYLKYYAGVNLTWENMTASLPDVMPKVVSPIYQRCNAKYRYYLNYCTFSYSMAFWDWKRWQQEIDWMALHGVNMSLAAVGVGTVWRNVLTKLGYDNDEINAYVAGPAYQAWFLMNNLEGWGGPNTDYWYEEQAKLQKQIIARMREFGIEPILPGYSGMLPSNAKEKLGLNAQNAGDWISFQRPSFLLPSDSRFEDIAKLYYDETSNLYGKANYYSMDPFHEMNPTPDNQQQISPVINFAEAGASIMAAMKRCNPNAKWIIQGWMENPKAELLKKLKAKDLLILDLNSDCCPQWGTSKTQWVRKDGYGKFPWLFCMLHNFGGAVGMFGKIDALIDNYYEAADSAQSHLMLGVGATMEAIENNSIMYELLYELPWRCDKRITKRDWLDGYVFARYGNRDAQLREAWTVFGNTLYDVRYEDQRNVASESRFTYRPDVSVQGAWAPSYNPIEVIEATSLMLSLSDKYQGNNNFEYDVVNLVRQTLADKAFSTYIDIQKAVERNDRAAFERLSGEFLASLLEQDRLLATRPEFMVGSWIDEAREWGQTVAEKDMFEKNAKLLITVWGTHASEATLHDYSHREWSGVLATLYHKRWSRYFDYLRSKMSGESIDMPDFYQMEVDWALSKYAFPSSTYGRSLDVAKEVFNSNFPKYKVD